MARIPPRPAREMDSDRGPKRRFPDQRHYNNFWKEEQYMDRFRKEADPYRDLEGREMETKRRPIEQRLYHPQGNKPAPPWDRLGGGIRTWMGNHVVDLRIRMRESLVLREEGEIPSLGD
jgi:hypothetical protein